ncbi:MAG: hypothetical protein KAH38_13095, partial [Candidatus Hydrogenedentes bacterium]|nr:hypothetical protein [Candidatus Hydrogenedentota bacterium]
MESENTPPPHPTRGGKWIIGILAGILLILAGMTVIFRAAALDTITIAGKPWSTTFILFDIPDELPELESYPIAARRVFRPDSLDDDIT